MDEKTSILWSLFAVILFAHFSSSAVTPPTYKKACEKTVADMMFLLDESGSVTRDNFQIVKKFVINLIGALKIGKDQVRVGVYTFSSQVRQRFQLNKYYDRNSMERAINNIIYTDGGTATDKALKSLREHAFRNTTGDREEAPNIAIVITDGHSSNERLTISEANKLKKKNVVMFSIGIGMFLRQSELEAMASEPVSEHMFTVNNFAELEGIINKLTTKTCDDSCISKGCQNGGTCSKVGNEWKCMCSGGFGGEYCQLEKDCHCSGYGDPHYKTFDGQVIHFMGVCKYTLAASTKHAPNFFAVEVKNEHRGNSRVSYTRMVDIKLNGCTIRLLPGNKMLVNGEERSFPIQGIWGISAKYSCGWSTVSTAWGLTVQFDGRHVVKVKLPGRFADKLTGICGDCNGKKDDFRTKDGQDVSMNVNKYSLIGDSYKVKDDSDKPSTKCNVTDYPFDCKPDQTKMCNNMESETFKKCAMKLGSETVKAYLESCRIDACAYVQNSKLFESVVCSAIEAFAGECAKAGILVNWRRSDFCPMTCPQGQIYKFQTWTDQPSCAKQQPKPSKLTEGCVCQNGDILSGKNCVSISKCGCLHNGFYMEANEELIDPKCQLKTICKAGGTLVKKTLETCEPNGICTVQNGKRACICKKGFVSYNGICIPTDSCVYKGCQNGGTCSRVGKVWKCMCKVGYFGKYCEHEKDCHCSGYGDPHYKTFDGQVIHFMGVCKYTLAASTKHAPNFFAVEVKNEHRGNSRVSYTRMVDIKLNGCTIRLLPGNKMLVNGEERSFPIQGIWGISAKYSCGWSTVSTAWGLTVQFDGRHVVKVKLPGRFADKLTGICGDCNGKKDDFRTKDGQDVSMNLNKYSLIGDSYKVKDDSDKPSTKCNVTDYPFDCKPDQTKMCNNMESETFKKCAMKLGSETVKAYLESCRIDACAYVQNSKLFESVVCSAIEAFAGECAKAGILVNWRRSDFCPMTCPQGQIYKFQTWTDQPSCAKQQPKPSKLTEGCVCQNGDILSGKNCVSISKCGCLHNGFYMEANEELIDPKCQLKTICKAGGTLVKKTLETCEPNGICTVQNGKRACICKKGFVSYNGICIPTDSCVYKGCQNGGTCSRVGKVWKCMCKVGYFGKYCEHEKDCHCSGYGDPHYKTFDGQVIHFMGVCKYTLAASTKHAPNFFAVEVKNEHRGNSRVSYTRMVDIKLNGCTIRLLPGNKMLVNGEERSFPIQGIWGISAKYSCGWSTVSTAWGLTVQFDGRHVVKVKLPGRFADKLTGICGDCNGKKDDFRTKDGQDVSMNLNKYSLIGDSYKVKDDSDKPSTKCNVTDYPFDCKPDQTKMCNNMESETFKKCAMKLGSETVKAYLESCRIDACAYVQNSKLFESVVCSAIEAFAGECAKAGILVNWRRSDFCPMTCPQGQIYKFQTWTDQPSCAKQQPKPSKLTEGCVCQNGDILSGKNCVSISKCGCLHNGFYMEANEELIDPKCQLKTICKAGGTLVKKTLETCEPNGICTVQNGKRACICKKGFVSYNGICIPTDSCVYKGCQNGGTCSRVGKVWKCMCKVGYFGKYCEHEKDCHCSGYGDPHYKTFDGQVIHFMGVCKYTLAASTKHAPNFFAVEVKNEHRGNSRVSYTRMVDIKLNGCTIRLLPGNKMLVNGEERSFPIQGIWGISAKYSCGWSTVSTAWGLTVQFDGSHIVKVKLPGRFADNLTGICGDCNGKKDDFRTKDGQDVSMNVNKYSLIGDSYKVKDDSDKPTTKCNVSDYTDDCKPDQTKMCNIINSKIFKKCAVKLGLIKVKNYLESCKIDACAYHNNGKLFKSVVCATIEAYAGECAKAGILVRWRPISLCPKTCPQGKIYEFQTSMDQPSCVNPLPKPSELIEGCVCPKGYLLSGKNCVHKSKCGCLRNGFYMEANEEYIDPKCQVKNICKAGGKLISMILEPCQPNGVCTIQNGKRACICKKGFYFDNIRCVPEVCKKTVADIMFLLDESGSVNKLNFKIVKKFVINLVRSWRIGKNKVRVGVFTFSRRVYKEIYLNKYFDQKSLEKAIEKIKYNGGSTKTHKGLRQLRKCAFIKGNGDRENVPNIAIIITDGRSSSKRSTKREATKLKNLGVVIFSIGIGKKLRESELKTMASKPVSEHMFTVNDFGDLQRFVNKIATKTCEDSCISKGCQNGGTCSKVGKEWKCMCNARYEGEYCEHAKYCHCSGYGDPHYKTFDGQVIHFMGICKYTLAASTEDAPNFFAVEVKNEHRGNSRVSYTRMVDIKLRGFTIRLLPGNNMLVNGAKRSFPIQGIWGISAKYSCGWSTVSTAWGLTVQFDGRHIVKVKLPGTFTNKLTGICGDCNGKKDDFRTKEGKDVSKNRNKYSLIGNSYKVKDDSDKPTAKCAVTDYTLTCNQQKTKMCDIIKSEIFKKCAAKLGLEKVKMYLQSCRIDACAYRKNIKLWKSVVCAAIEAYAGECAKAGVIVSWRSASLCPKTCPQGKVYKFQTWMDQPSCANPLPKPSELIEGCVCPKGYLLSGQNCVHKSKCGCFHMGFYMEANEEIIDPTCQVKAICKAGGKVIYKELEPCHLNAICSIQNEKHACICKKGFVSYKGICQPEVCKKTVADIMFLLDESGSVKKYNFKIVKKFVINLVRSWRIGKNKVRVGVFTFSKRVYKEFYLNKYFDQKSMEKAIKRIRFNGGRTKTHKGLRQLRKSAFSKRHGDRKNVPNIAIVITDGKSYNKKSTKREAAKLKRLGVVVFSIGIGKKLRQSELKAMASKPVSEHKFTVNDFGDLQGIVNKIATKTCEDSCISKGCKNGGKCRSISKEWKCICKAGYSGKYCQHACRKSVADIMFLIDESGSVGKPNFKKVKKFVINVVRRLKISKNKVRVGVYTFSSRARKQFHLNKYFHKRSMKRAIKRIKYRGGSTKTHKGLRSLRRYAFRSRNGDRKNVQNIAIVITDGKSSNKRLTVLEAAKLKRRNVVMFSIGIGKKIRQSELEAMASQPVSEHKFTVNNFNSLQCIVNKITTKTCEDAFQ